MAFSGNSDNDDVMSEMNVTPLVDVMLVLLVVFIVTAPLLTKSIPLNLPKTHAVAPANTPKPLVVSVDKSGNYYIGQTKVSLDELQSQVSQAHSSNPNQGVQLRADQGVQYGNVAKAMADIQRAGVTRLAVMTQP